MSDGTEDDTKSPSSKHVLSLQQLIEDTNEEYSVYPLADSDVSDESTPPGSDEESELSSIDDVFSSGSSIPRSHWLHDAKNSKAGSDNGSQYNSSGISDNDNAGTLLRRLSSSLSRRRKSSSVLQRARSENTVNATPKRKRWSLFSRRKKEPDRALSAIEESEPDALAHIVSCECPISTLFTYLAPFQVGDIEGPLAERENEKRKRSRALIRSPSIVIYERRATEEMPEIIIGDKKDAEADHPLMGIISKDTIVTEYSSSDSSQRTDVTADINLLQKTLEYLSDDDGGDYDDDDDDAAETSSISGEIVHQDVLQSDTEEPENHPSSHNHVNQLHGLHNPGHHHHGHQSQGNENHGHHRHGRQPGHQRQNVGHIVPSSLQQKFPEHIQRALGPWKVKAKRKSEQIRLLDQGVAANEHTQTLEELLATAESIHSEGESSCGSDVERRRRNREAMRAWNRKKMMESRRERRRKAKLEEIERSKSNAYSLKRWTQTSSGVLRFEGRMETDLKFEIQQIDRFEKSLLAKISNASASDDAIALSEKSLRKCMQRKAIVLMELERIRRVRQSIKKKEKQLQRKRYMMMFDTSLYHRRAWNESATSIRKPEVRPGTFIPSPPKNFQELEDKLPQYPSHWSQVQDHVVWHERSWNENENSIRKARPRLVDLYEHKRSRSASPGRTTTTRYEHERRSRSVERAIRTRQNLKSMHSECYDQAIKELSFQPVIPESTRQLLRSKPRKQRGDVWSRLYEDARRIRKRRRQMVKETLRRRAYEEMLPCTFHPKTVRARFVRL